MIEFALWSYREKLLIAFKEGLEKWLRAGQELPAQARRRMLPGTHKISAANLLGECGMWGGYAAQTMRGLRGRCTKKPL